MKKQQFLEELKRRLAKLKDEEIEDIINEFSEHIDLEVASGKDEEAVVDGFGDVNELVRELLDAYNLNDSVGDRVEQVIKSIVVTGEEVFEKVVDYTKETVDHIQKKAKEKEETVSRKTVQIKKQATYDFKKVYRFVGMAFLINLFFSIFLGLGGLISPFRIDFLYKMGWFINHIVFTLLMSAFLITLMIHIAFKLFGNQAEESIVEVKPKQDGDVKVEVKKTVVKRNSNQWLKIILLIVLIPILLPIVIGLGAMLFGLFLTSMIGLVPTILAFGFLVALAISSGLWFLWFIVILLLGIIIIQITVLDFIIDFVKWLFKPRVKKTPVKEGE